MGRGRGGSDALQTGRFVFFTSAQVARDVKRCPTSFDGTLTRTGTRPAPPTARALQGGAEAPGKCETAQLKNRARSDA